MPRLENIYNFLQQENKITVDFNAFKNKMQYGDYQEKVFNFVKERKKYSKDLQSFKGQYGQRQKMNHVVDMKEEAKGFSNMYIEKDFTTRMNEQYKDADGNQLIQFIETSPGADRFKMKDMRTGKYSEEIQLPGFQGMSIPKIIRWDQINEKVKKFVDNPTTPDEQFVQDKKEATEKIYKAIDGVIKNAGADIDFFTEENISYLKDYVTNGKFIQKASLGGGTEADTDYDFIQKALKKEVGDFGGIFGGSFSPDGEYNKLNEVDIETIIQDAITKKFQHATDKLNTGRSEAFASLLEADDLTIDKVNKEYLKFSKDLFAGNKEAIELMQGIEAARKLKPGTPEFERQYEINKELLKDYGPRYEYDTEFLVDLSTMAAVDPADPTQLAGGVAITKEDLDNQEEKIKLTYGDKIKDAFYANGHMKTLSDRQGQEEFNITINDPQAYAIFEQLGYKSTGKNDKGYEFEIKLKDLAKYYDATVKSDGFSFVSPIIAEEDREQVDRYKAESGGPMTEQGRRFDQKYFSIDTDFESPVGFFGLTEKLDGQTFPKGVSKGIKGVWNLDEDEYTTANWYGGEDKYLDKSRGFKRLLKTYRDDRFEIIKNNKVLSKMYLLNIDPTTTKSMLPTRAAELIYEGTAQVFGAAAATPGVKAPFTSVRSEKDIFENVTNIYQQWDDEKKTFTQESIPLSEKQKESIRRSAGYKIYEGVAGFVPMIAEFAIIDLAINKGVSLPTLPGRLIRRGQQIVKTKEKGKRLQKALYHTYGMVKEEFKMRQAFDQHYHMGGGAGFYAVGTFMPWFKTAGVGLQGTASGLTKSGFAGAISSQAALNLESLVKDVKGGENYMTFIKENYSDLSETSQDFLVDFFTFAIVGGKGYVGKKNSSYHWKTMSKVRKIQGEFADNIVKWEKELKELDKDSPEAKELQNKIAESMETFMFIQNRLPEMQEIADWQDVEKATEKLNKIGGNLKKLFGEDITFEAVNERTNSKTGESYFKFDDSKAEVSGDGKKLYVDVTKVTPGTMPHEVFHMGMKKLFKENPEVLRKFKESIADKFKGIKYNVGVRDKEGKLTGETKEMGLEEMIKNEHGHQGDFNKIKDHEFMAYVAETLADPMMYSKYAPKGVFGEIKRDINRFSNRNFGTNVFETGTKQDVIDFLYNFGVSTKNSNLTNKQLNMFKKIRENGTFAEKVDADSRTLEEISKQEKAKTKEKQKKQSEKVTKEKMPSKSVELSSNTQKVYDSIVKGKTGSEFDAGVGKMIKPSGKPGKYPSVAGENFDNIIYDLIEKMYPKVYDNPMDAYTLALEMVYNLEKTPDAKNRGVVGILKEYEARKDFVEVDKEGSEKSVVFDKEGDKKLTKKEITDLENKYESKIGSKEFAEQAEAEGYKGKQNVTKTVREQLIKRIHELKEKSIGEEIYTESLTEMSEYGKEIISEDIGGFEFKSHNEKLREEKGKKKLNVLEVRDSEGNLAFGGRKGAEALVKIRRNTTSILTDVKTLNDLRSSVIADKITKETVDIVKERVFGREPGMKKKDYYDIQKKVFENSEKYLYEAGLPENRDLSTSETTNIAKTVFGNKKYKIYEEKGEFTYKELNQGIAADILTDSQKAEGRKKFPKAPYKKGILTDVVFEGSRKDTHHKRVDILAPHLANTIAWKIMDNQLKNPRFVEMLKAKNPGVYEGLQFESVLKSVRQNIRGVVPEALASKNIKTSAEVFAEKIRSGMAARPAMLEIIANNENLKPYKEEILREMQLGIDDLATTGELFIKVGESRRLIGVIKGEAAKPMIFESGFSGKKGNSIKKELDKLKAEMKLSAELLNYNKTTVDRQRDKDFTRPFYEKFIPEFFNTFDMRLVNLKGPDRGGLGTSFGFGIERPGHNELVDDISNKRKPGYKFRSNIIDGVETGKWYGKRRKVVDKEMRNGIFEGIKGEDLKDNEVIKKLIKKDKSGKSLYEYIKVNDNASVSKIVDKALVEFKGVENPLNIKRRKQYIEHVKKQLSPDKTLEGYEKMLKANDLMLEHISEKMFDYMDKVVKSGKKGAVEEAINNLTYLMQMQTSLGGGWFRGLASHKSVTLTRSGNLDLGISKRYRSEHQFQLANLTGNLLLNTLKFSGNKKGFMSNTKPLIREYKQSIINKELQEKIDSAEFGGKTSSIWSKEGMTTDVMSEANYLLERSIMEGIVDLKSGQTYAEILDGRLRSGAGFKKLAEVSKKHNLPSKNVTESQMARNMRIMDKAVANGRKLNKKRRGMSTFDFDETVGISDNFVIARKDGKTKKIASNEWPFVGEKMVEEGWQMDFTDFNRVTKGRPGPLMQKMKNQIEKFGPDNVFILTARAPESQSAIHEYLKTEGINIPKENITGLGNSTGEAKAMWMLEKFSEGYNDMYFVDDALPNVKAVKEVLDQLDIKSDVQQALASKNLTLNSNVNKILERSLGIEAEKRFSAAEAKVRGKDIKRRRIFMRDSAADLELLIEPLYGKGKKGIEDKKWFKKEFVMPFERGVRDYNAARQSAKNDYINLRKQNKDVVKVISQPVEGTAFTNDMAMRVYLWNKAGYKIPDLAKTTEAKLVQHIVNNPKLRAYAENFARITKQEKGLKEPGENWWGETMAGEVTNINRGVSRKQYLQEWIDIKNEIFTEENLNKMESKLGTQWRENITDMFDRMETGRTRSLKMDRGSAAMMNYLNGGIGTIMNFNTRSAMLQTISTTNFLNMRENNPIAAARAMSNVKQFSKDFMRIMNSDMLKQRRDGLSINVTEAEIASAAASSTNMIQSVISKVLKAGYIPTKLADSFAISFGGATFYRNRIKMYEKQGMKTKEAEKQAFLDFQVIAERTQQSSRADLLSKQQTSLIGRFILPFANTPMQMNRAGMKDILDISKGRFKGGRELTEKVGRISYYMGAQVAIFAGLQSALFAMLLNDDNVSDEKIANTKSMTVNTITDSMLRGFGVQGAVISAFKNATQEYFKQSKKPGFTADYSEVAEDLLNLSPPIGSKFGMLDRAGDTKKWAKIEGDDKFKLELGNPSLEASLMTIQAVTNAPVYSPYQNMFNLKHAMSDQYETWQRFLMATGWTPYSVGIETEKKKKDKKDKKDEKVNKKIIRSDIRF